MKFLLFVSAFLLSSATLADEVIIGSNPVIPGTCEQRGVDYLGYNSNMIKVEEGNIVTISFSSVYGRCNLSNEFKIKKFSPYTSVAVSKAGISLPWEYEPTAEIKIVNEKLARITIELDKDIMFANTNKALIKLKVVPKKNLPFYWWINLSYDSKEDITTIK